jgi:hypothetical protein
MAVSMESSDLSDSWEKVSIDDGCEAEAACAGATEEVDVMLILEWIAGWLATGFPG